MLTHGFHDAQLTGRGADGGVDVVAAEAVAQVKAQTAAVRLGEVQRIYGIAAAAGRQALLFSLAGFTKDAREWGDRHGVALFTFDLESDVRPSSQAAERLVRWAQEAPLKPPVSCEQVEKRARRMDPRVVELVHRAGSVPYARIVAAVIDSGERVVDATTVLASPTGPAPWPTRGMLALTDRRLLFGERSPDRVACWPLYAISAEHVTTGRASAELTLRYVDQKLTFNLTAPRRQRLMVFLENLSSLTGGRDS
jgi:hypothetical protein